jgi:hypothetical protein
MAMLEWTISKVATTAVVLSIALSVLGLFGMEAASVRSMELERLADAVADLVVDVDMLACEATCEVDWTSSSECFGLPRAFHGDAYTIVFSSQRPCVVWRGERAAGHPFASAVRLLDADGGPVELLEVRSTEGFVVSSQAEWAPWGVDLPLHVRPLQ